MIKSTFTLPENSFNQVFALLARLFLRRRFFEDFSQYITMLKKDRSPLWHTLPRGINDFNKLDYTLPEDVSIQVLAFDLKKKKKIYLYPLK